MKNLIIALGFIMASPAIFASASYTCDEYRGAMVEAYGNKAIISSYSDGRYKSTTYQYKLVSVTIKSYKGDCSYSIYDSTGNNTKDLKTIAYFKYYG